MKCISCGEEIEKLDPGCRCPACGATVKISARSSAAVARSTESPEDLAVDDFVTEMLAGDPSDAFLSAPCIPEKGRLEPRERELMLRVWYFLTEGREPRLIYDQLADEYGREEVDEAIDRITRKIAIEPEEH